MKSTLWFVALLLAEILSSPVQAQVPNTIWSRFEPLVYSKEGVLLGCGVAFSATNADQRRISGSVVAWHTKSKNNSSLTVKLTGGIVEGDQLGDQRVTAGWIETARFSTRDGFTLIPSDNPDAVLMQQHSLNLTAEGMTLWAEAVDSLFTLVPWRPVIEKALGRQVSGVVRGEGISWELGRKRGLGIGM